MTKFNINDYILVQITDIGWNHLNKTVGKEYIEACIIPYKQVINNKDWYRLQAHNVMSLLGESTGHSQGYINSNILIDL